MMSWICQCLAAVVLLACHRTAQALEPRDVFVLVNRRVSASADVAAHYVAARGVPRENVVTLDLPITEEIARADYEEQLAKPLRAALRPRWEQCRVLVTTYGVPLRVGPVPSTEAEIKELKELRQTLAERRSVAQAKRMTATSVEEEIAKLNLTSMKPRLEELRKEVAEAERKVRETEEAERRLEHAESEAAVDSELMQLWWDDYPKHRWITNPLYWRLPERVRRGMPTVLMTARLDGPTPAIAKRIVDDAIWAEKAGLRGITYVDARGIAWDRTADLFGIGYGGYDESFREMARLLGREAQMPVQLDNVNDLFAPHSCLDCSLYCGWYSVRNYVPCCKFVRGAVAWHLASFEAVSLRHPQKMWCSNLLLDGACATMGAVAEPYTIAFPRPAEFFGFLVSGEYTLVECYAKSLMLSSWMITLVGDPLYNPYKTRPRLKSAQVPASPAGAKFQWDR